MKTEIWELSMLLSIFLYWRDLCNFRFCSAAIYYPHLYPTWYNIKNPSKIPQTDLSLNVDGRVKRGKGHVVKVSERHWARLQLTSFLVLAVTQFHLQLRALRNVVMLAVDGAVPAKFLGTMRIRGPLNGRIVESDLAEHGSGQVKWRRSVDLTHLNAEWLHPLTRRLRTRVDGLVL